MKHLKVNWKITEGDNLYIEVPDDWTPKQIEEKVQDEANEESDGRCYSPRVSVDDENGETIINNV